ncbi:MAG: hypothetical protein AAGA30_13520, partial [Planctomycetota bacterium]
LNSSFSAKLLPIWFDCDEFDRLVKTFDQEYQELNGLTDGELIYLTTIYSSTNHVEKKLRYWKQIATRNSALVQNWLPIVEYMVFHTGKNNGVLSLQKKQPSLGNIQQSIAGFLIAKDSTANLDNRVLLVLELLSLCTNYEYQYPEFAAASLFQAIRILDSSNLEKQKQEALVLKSELHSKFKTTYHGQLSSNQKKD